MDKYLEGIINGKVRRIPCSMTLEEREIGAVRPYTDEEKAIGFRNSRLNNASYAYRFIGNYKSSGPRIYIDEIDNDFWKVCPDKSALPEDLYDLVEFMINHRIRDDKNNIDTELAVDEFLTSIFKEAMPELFRSMRNRIKTLEAKGDNNETSL